MQTDLRWNARGKGGTRMRVRRLKYCKTARQEWLCWIASLGRMALIGLSVSRLVGCSPFPVRHDGYVQRGQSPERVDGHVLERLPPITPPVVENASRLGEPTSAPRYVDWEAPVNELDRLPAPRLPAPRLPQPVSFTSQVYPDERLTLTAQPSVFTQVANDHWNYYSFNNLAVLGTGFAGGAIMANTNVDRTIYEHFNASVLHAPSDEWYETLHAPKEMGNGIYTLPVFGAAWGLGRMSSHPSGQAVGEWGERCLRTFLVGAPPVLVMQRVTGAGRPEEGSSAWDIWSDNNGVSGHAFMGSLPFLAMAQMSEKPLAKLSFYAISVAVPLSRINDGDHYTSQVVLGWWMAWSASMAVDATQAGDQNWRLHPLVGPDYSGGCFELRW
ncbi:MAG: phosphatase PAP2 family protein [Planctomycetales bacterium]|nr:phosphatase PAP2 family protein [Planctomycetales bacterium]